MRQKPLGGYVVESLEHLGVGTEAGNPVGDDDNGGALPLHAGHRRLDVLLRPGPGCGPVLAQCGDLHFRKTVPPQHRSRFLHCREQVIVLAFVAHAMSDEKGAGLGRDGRTRFRTGEQNPCRLVRSHHTLPIQQNPRIGPERCEFVSVDHSVADHGTCGRVGTQSEEILGGVQERSPRNEQPHHGHGAHSAVVERVEGCLEGVWVRHAEGDGYRNAAAQVGDGGLHMVVPLRAAAVGHHKEANGVSLVVRRCRGLRRRGRDRGAGNAGR